MPVPGCLGRLGAMLEAKISMAANAVFIACSLILAQAEYRVDRVSGEDKRDQKTMVTRTGNVVIVLNSKRCRNCSGRGHDWSKYRGVLEGERAAKAKESVCTPEAQK